VSPRVSPAPPGTIAAIAVVAALAVPAYTADSPAWLNLVHVETTGEPRARLVALTFGAPLPAELRHEADFGAAPEPVLPGAAWLPAGYAAEIERSGAEPPLSKVLSTREEPEGRVLELRITSPRRSSSLVVQFRGLRGGGASGCGVLSAALGDRKIRSFAWSCTSGSAEDLYDSHASSSACRRKASGSSCARRATARPSSSSSTPRTVSRPATRASRRRGRDARAAQPRRPVGRREDVRSLTRRGRLTRARGLDGDHVERDVVSSADLDRAADGRGPLDAEVRELELHLARRAQGVAVEREAHRHADRLLPAVDLELSVEVDRPLLALERADPRPAGVKRIVGNRPTSSTFPFISFSISGRSFWLSSSTTASDPDSTSSASAQASGVPSRSILPEKRRTMSRWSWPNAERTPDDPVRTSIVLFARSTSKRAVSGAAGSSASIASTTA